MKFFFHASIYALTIFMVSSAEAEETLQYSSQAAALAALTGPAKSTDSKNPAQAEDDDVVEIPVDTPTISNVRANLPVAGETGQL